MSAAPRQALLVLGMHRAGTSALARVASLLGAGLPADLMPANAGNPTGYWEPSSIVAFNDRLLGHFATQWDDPFAAAALPAPEAIPAAFHEEAARLIDEAFAGQPLFVLKDPRCSLLAGFWRAVLESRGIACAPVVVMRPPEEVARSLAARDGADPVASTLLYTGYALQCAAFAQAHGAPVVTYAQLLADWRSTMTRIGTACGVRWPTAPEAGADAVADFLRPARPASRDPVALPPDIARWAAATWAWMAAQAEEGAAAVDLGPARAGMAVLAARVAPVLADRTRRQREAEARAQAEAARLAGERDRSHALFEASQADLAQAATARDVAQAERDRVHAMFEASQADLAKAAEARDAAQAERDRVHAMFEASQADLSQAAEARDAAVAERDRIHALFEASQADLAQAAEARDAAQADRDRIHALFEASQADLARTVAERDELLAERAHMRAEHDVLCDLHAGTLQALHERELALDRMERARDRLQSELETMLASHSWRLTRPLRDVRRWAGGLRTTPLLPTPAPAAAAASRMAERVGDAPAPDRQGAVTGEASTPVAAPDSGPAGTAAVDDVHVPEGLRTFLHGEFGPRTADEVAATIESFRLPIDTGEVRTAARTTCEPGEALERVRALADIPQRSATTRGTPDVSIVVPVYNQLRFTLACLDALLRHRSRYRFEILVGDDASGDATAEALSVPVPGVRHVRHDGNLGFVRNCNATAAQARGRHVVFLNNDTLVLPGWLDELVDTLERDAGVGLAGSKLVYPDGRLQECGAIVWRDGSAWNFGRFDDPRKPEYGYLRDVDYVSGASIAVPRALWERLGGFDELFAPAYAEDADLAFRIRAEGLRTVVQPRSQLLHFEGVSSGTDTTQGAKAYQVRNLERLRERWSSVIATHRDNADQPELEKERGVHRRVLFIDHCTPTPQEDAGSRVAWEVMAAFQAHGCKVTFIPEDNFAHMGEDTHALQRIGIEPVYHPACSSMAQFLEARHDRFDLVFLHRYGVGEAHMAAMRRHFPGAKVVFLNADMHFLRELRAAELAGDARALAAARGTRERELAVARGADVVLVHSDVEQSLLREACPGKEVVLLPLVHDPVPSPAPLAGRTGVCFVGGFRHPPNADGIAWFAREAWPRVLAACPDAVLHIAGSHATPEVQALAASPNVVVEGFVRDLGVFLDARRVSVAPLRYGAGAKGKVAESLAHGLPTVCTPVAVEGMGLAPGDNVLVGADPAQLAAHVVSLLGDDQRWQALSEAGVRYAADVTSRARAHARIGDLLATLGIAD